MVRMTQREGINRANENKYEYRVKKRKTGLQS